MATISISANLRALIGAFDEKFTSGNLDITPAADAAVRNEHSVGTTPELLVVGDIGTIGYCVFKNLDQTDTITLSLDAPGAAPFATLKPGEFALVRLSNKLTYAKASANTPKLAYILCSD